MAKAKKDRDLETNYSLPAFVIKLRRLADCLESGQRFHIQIAGERLLVPKGAIFSIEHEREGDQEEIEFQIKWTRSSV
jgi:amphi-Trp domain-containing protein